LYHGTSAFDHRATIDLYEPDQLFSPQAIRPKLPGSQASHFAGAFFLMKAGPDTQSNFALNRTDSPNECDRGS
jgi:hypothetical protein